MVHEQLDEIHESLIFVELDVFFGNAIFKVNVTEKNRKGIHFINMSSLQRIFD